MFVSQSQVVVAYLVAISLEEERRKRWCLFWETCTVPDTLGQCRFIVHGWGCVTWPFLTSRESETLKYVDNLDFKFQKKPDKAVETITGWIQLEQTGTDGTKVATMRMKAGKAKTESAMLFQRGPRMEGHRSGATTYPFSSLLKGPINFARQNRPTVKSDKSPNNTRSCDSVNLSLTLDPFPGSQDWQKKNLLSLGVIFTQKFCQKILFEIFPGFVPCFFASIKSSKTFHHFTWKSTFVA